MFDKPKATLTLGLDLGLASLKCASLAFQMGKPRLDAVFEIPLETIPGEEGNVKQLYNGDEKKRLLPLLEQNLVVTCISASEVLVRPLEVKLTKINSIDAVLPFQSEPLIPYPIDNALLDRVIISQSKESTLLTVVAVRKDHLKQHLEQWKALKIEPEMITAASSALVQFANQFAANDNPFYIIHLGLQTTTCVLINKGKLIASQTIPLGVDTLIEALAQDKSEGAAAARLHLSQLLGTKGGVGEASPRYTEAFEALRLELTKTVYALAKQIKGVDVNEILVVGEGAVIENLAAALLRNLNKTTTAPTPNTQFPLSVPELQNYSIAIGAALSALPKAQDQLNFRQGEFAYPNPWKRLKQPLAIYFGLCILAAIALYFTQKAYFNYQEDSIKRSYLDLLVAMKKPYEQFEKEIDAKKPADARSESIPKPSELTLEGIRMRLGLLEKEIQATPQTFPLLPNVPLVSDVLGWLSTHPNVIGKKEAGEPSLQIESFSYTFVKRPELVKKQEKYQVKIDLEFSAPTPKMAREFHDALIAPNDFVDPKGEVKWSSNRDRYRTSFYLKDKTSYPAP